MKRFWFKVRVPLTVLCFFILTVFFLRLFSGPEDTWIKDKNGEWVKHGNPAMPMPSDDYVPPLSWKIMPLLFLFSFEVPLFFHGFHKLQNRLNFDTANRDIKFLGYLSVMLVLLGIFTMLSCTVVFAQFYESEHNFRAEDIASLQMNLAFIQMIYIFAGICIITGVAFFLLKRNINDNYHLERGSKELQDFLEKFPFK